MTFVTKAPNYLLLLKTATTSDQMSEALKLFYNETSHLVFAFGRKKGLSLENTEDLVQTVYTQIYRKRLQYLETHSQLAWLYIITRSEAKDAFKAEKIYRGYLEDYSLFLSQNSDTHPSTAQERIVLDQADLNEREKDLLERRYQNDEDFDEIAKALGMSSVSVRKAISRALAKIKKGAPHGT